MTALSYDMTTLGGETVSLSKYKGNVVLMVNVASECGLTPQYEQLQALHEKYSGQGLAVVGFPCNQFGRQEPGTPAEIREFCQSNYGVTFPKQKELDEYLELLEEAKKRDHRKLGAELELFMFSDRVGAGLPIWLPKGMALRDAVRLCKDAQILAPHPDRYEQAMRGNSAAFGSRLDRGWVPPTLDDLEAEITAAESDDQSA